jgi:biotin synthase
MPPGSEQLDRASVLVWLQETDPDRLEQLWARADAVRSANVGDAVHLRGLIEISNTCVRSCLYCGLRAESAQLVRYRMIEEEVAGCARQAAALGYGSVVIQGGEDPGLTCAAVAAMVRRIKAETGLAVTLSLGERSTAEFEAWRRAGADRYLLRFETSDSELYRRLHPGFPGAPANRIGLLLQLRQLGYEIGTGVMVGLPGQSWDSLANDLLCFQELDADMIGVGPFLPNPATPLGAAPAAFAGAEDQARNDELTTLKVIALARLLCPEANIPSTTALATLDPEAGRELGLLRGANVVMPNVTPAPYRQLYEIYPGKACVNETASACQGCLGGRIRALGRQVGSGPGERRRSGSSGAGNLSHECGKSSILAGL